MRQWTKKWAKIIQDADKKGKNVIFDYLFLTDCKKLMAADIKILIDAPLQIRYKRMLERSNGRFKFSMEEFESMSRLVESSISGFKPDIVIDNSLDNGLEKQVDEILKFIDKVNSKE